MNLLISRSSNLRTYIYSNINNNRGYCSTTSSSTTTTQQSSEIKETFKYSLALKKPKVEKDKKDVAPLSIHKYPKVDIKKLNGDFLKLIDPNNLEADNGSLESTKPALSYRSRLDMGTIVHPVVLSPQPIPEDYKLLPISEELVVVNQLDQTKIPRLAHGLEKTITQPGVHPVTDFDGTINFSRYLSNIHDFDSLILHSNYTVPSKDTTLVSKTKEYGCKFLSSTSSITTVLTKMYLALYHKFTVNQVGLNTWFQSNSKFTPQVLRPTSITLSPLQDTIWAIDINNGNMPKNNKVLMDLGHSLEKMLTLDEEEFTSKLLKSKNTTAHEFDDSYVFSKVGNIMYRSQIDCYSDLIKGESKVFDLKTRATKSIRYNVEEHDNHLDYQIKNVVGLVQSYEREFYDMSRSSGIKYALQAKIGNMDGIFVCYHNTKRIFGSEYISLKELERVVFWGNHIADDAFKAINSCLDVVLSTITKSFDRKYNYRLFFHVNDKQSTEDMSIFVEELSVSDAYQSQVFSYLRSRDLTIKESQQIVNPVTQYTLSTITTVNGLAVTGAVHYNPTDTVQIHYKLNKEEKSPEVLYKYAEVIRQSNLYMEFSG